MGTVSGGFLQEIILLASLSGLDLRGCRLPATARLSAPSGMPETGLGPFYSVVCVLQSSGLTTPLTRLACNC